MLDDSYRTLPDGNGSETSTSDGFSSPWSFLSDHRSGGYHHNGRLGAEPEPIAIIGMGCRLPGTAQDPAGLWDMLVSGRTAWTPGPGKRFNMKAFQDPTAQKSGTTNTCGGHFLREDVATFDAALFGINPVEAMAMDPQHRLLLEIAYESFQDAGLTVDLISGSNTGVYVGQWSSDYHEIETRDIDDPPLYLITGTGPALASNRVSYHFNLRGPSFTIDTGCSSSLVALHQAVQSLRSGETSQCFVGGVNLLLDPQRFSYQSRMKMFSAEGRSFAFDSRADGYGRGEGCTGVILKPLSVALRDRNHVRAIIRNSVLNQDGRTPGISVPSAEAQKEAIVKAYRQASLELHADYVEAHGTGTKVGDPIEVGAIAAAFATQDSVTNFQMPIGSVKANIGHTEGAAGLAGLIKAVLMLENGIVPPQVNYETCNPDILLEQWNLRIPTRLERRNLGRISVNSFGYGGTNAHIIVDGAAAALLSLTKLPLENSIIPAPYVAPAPHVFFFSAASERSCQRMCARLAKYLALKYRNSGTQENVLARLAYTLGKQSVHPFRVSLVASSIDELVDQLIATTRAATPRRDKNGQPRIAFAFSGQGAQYAEMGRELLGRFPVFVRSLERARQQLVRLGCPWDLLSELCRPKAESRINEPAIAQPASTAIQLALVDLLADLDVHPCAVAGHSSGEIAAAYAARAIPFEDAITTSYYRGKFTSDLLAGDSAKTKEPSGAMIAVGASAETIADAMAAATATAGAGSCLNIACFNSPSSVTVSGDATAIDALKERLDDMGTFNRKLPTNGAAYHSRQMKLIEKTYALSLKKLQIGSVPSVPMFSSVTGEELNGRIVLDGSYWVQNLLSPVLFQQAVSSMCSQEYRDQSIDMVIEVGPHSQLGGPINQTLKALGPASSSAIEYASILKRGEDAEISLLRCLGHLHVQTTSLCLNNLNKVDGDRPPSRLVDLPPYPFDHDRTFWHETRISKDYRHRKHLPHDLLGTLSPDVNRLEPRWRRLLSLKEIPWLRGHSVQEQIVFPATGYLTMVVQAVKQHKEMTDPTWRVENVLLRNISISKALVLPEEGTVEITLSLRPEPRTARESSGVWNEFRIFTVSGNDGRWTEHCRGLVQAETETEPAGAVDDEMLQPQYLSRVGVSCTHAATPQKFYHLSRGIGLDWQDPFDNIYGLRTGPNSGICFVSVGDNTSAEKGSSGQPLTGGMGDILHPALLDSALFHALVAIPILEKGMKTPIVPTFIKQLRISNQTYTKGTELICSAVSSSDQSPTYDVFIRDKSQNGVVVVAQGIRAAALPGDISGSMAGVPRDLSHGTEWVAFVDAWTPEHCDKTCKSVIDGSSNIDQIQFQDALTQYFVHRAVGEVRKKDVPKGHKRRFFSWMRDFVRKCPTIPESCPEKDPRLDIGALGEAILRLGPELPAILTNKTDPLSILTPDGLLDRLYNSGRSSRCILQMAEYCRHLAKQTPSLKVLEVGAGTASATVPILQAMNGSDGIHGVRSYDFTDISQGFFAPAREQLGTLADVVRFSVLDVERSPSEQGFEEGTYDLVIASNVIHATGRISVSLENVHALLKPGGRLLLMEITNVAPHYNLIFGVFEGWWAGYEDGRRKSPLLTREQWTPKLKEAGFSKSEPCFEDYPADEGGTLTVFIVETPYEDGEGGRAQEATPIRLVTTENNISLVEGSISHFRNSLPRDTLVSVHCLETPVPGGGVAILLPEVEKTLRDAPSEGAWNGFKKWALGEQSVVLVSYGCEDEPDGSGAGLWTGIARCLRLERPDVSVVTLHLDPHNDSSVLDLLSSMLPALLKNPSTGLVSGGSGGVENEFYGRDGQLFVRRFVARPEINDYVQRSKQQSTTEIVPFLGVRSLTAELGIPGLLESIRWKDDVKVPDVLGPDDVKLELRAASVNFKDVLIAAGQLDGITEMRNDCSGVVIEVGSNMRDRFSPGDRVCALYSRSYTNHPIVHGDCVHKVPESMCFEFAASLPIVWCTVYYSLVDMGHLVRGNKILIHSAAGAVGQAAIMLAQHMGAEVFATVGSEAKADMLRRRYSIPASHIFSSRNTAFLNGIKRATNGHGVDVVLNSLGGEIFRQSCNLVAPFGRFVEIGRKDLMDDALMPMGFLLKNITFAYVDLTLVIDNNKPLASRLLRDVVRLFELSVVRPVTLTVMPISEIESAFRQIQAGKHTGKIILRVEKDQTVKAVPPPPAQAQLRPDATYIVVGGLGGLGRAVISWMAECGARNILSISRSGLKDKSGQDFVAEVERQGVKVVAKSCDVACEESVASLINDMGNDGLPPVRGIIQSAMVLNDTVFEDMTVSQWRGTLDPKIHGTENLHTHLAATASVDFFVVMSSIVALRGNVGQSNYAAACCYQDALVRRRAATGLPAFSINLGPVLEVGFVSEKPDVAASLRRRGMTPVCIVEVLALLNYAVTNPTAATGGYHHPTHAVCSLGLMPSDTTASASADSGLRERRFAHLVKHEGEVLKRPQGTSADVAQELECAGSFDEAVGVVCRVVLVQLGKLIATPPETLNPASSLDSYGVDSLVAVELRNWIGAYLQANVQLMVLRGTGSINELAKIVAKESRLVDFEYA